MTAQCPVCRGHASILLDGRAKAPVLMHELFDNAEAARGCKTAAIELRRCTDCGFAWNAAFDPDAIHYGPGYDNAQGYSENFRAHLDQRIDAIFADLPADFHPVIVEVGAGQGDFLARILARHGARVKAAYGFDPAWRGADGDGPMGARLYRRLFDASASAAMADCVPDIVISRHTIEHIGDPLAFLAAIRGGIGAREGVRLYVETPDIGWIVHHKAFEDVFYEHCSIFDAPSLARAMMETGFAQVEVEHCFGAQYLWARGISGQKAGAAFAKEAFDAHGIGAEALAHFWREKISEIKADGGTFLLWGAGAKGINFAQLVDPDHTLITALVDVNPGKQGRHIGLSGHKVLAPEDVAATGASDILVMNPNYAAEIHSILANHGVTANLLALHGDKHENHD